MNVELTTLHTPTPTPTGNYVPSGSGRDVVAFLTIVYVAATAIAMAFPGTIKNPGPAPLLSLFVPALAVAALYPARRRRATGLFPLGLRRPGISSWPAALALPVLAIGVPYILAAALGIVQIVDVRGYLTNVPIQLALLTVLVLGEEIGWRGYMLPRLSTSMPPRRASLITGFAQGIFHLPLILLTASYDSAGNRVVVATGAVIVIGLGGIIFGWLRTRSASLWPVALAHAAVNTCIIESPHLTSINPDRAAYIIGESGALTLALTAFIAAWIYRRANWNARHDG